jgi:hypothetical protein
MWIAVLGQRKGLPFDNHRAMLNNDECAYSKREI